MALIAGAILLTSCGSSATQASRPQVVATAYPLYEAASVVGGDRIKAINLLASEPQGSISAKDADVLRHAALAVVLGGGTQPDVDKIVEQRTGPTIKILGDGDVHASSTDFHIWLDPQKMTEIVETVADAIRGVVPNSDAFLDKNTKRYESALAEIDRNYVHTLATCSRSSFLVEQPEFSSLATRYDLHQVAVGELTTASANTEAKQIIERERATTVFAPKLPSLDEAVEIRKMYGVRVAVLDPIVTRADQARRGGVSYRVIMGLNLDALRAALSCDEKKH